MTFVIKNNEYFLVLEQRSAHISQAGEICFPGGRFDHHLDHSTQDTAIRETCEEIGVKPHEIQHVRYFGTYIAPAHTLIDVYIGLLTIDDPQQLPINKSEVAKLLVMPYSYFVNQAPSLYEIDGWSSPYRRSYENQNTTIFPAKKLGLPPKYHEPWRGKPRQIYLYPTDDVPIWGITAKIIAKFAQQYPDPHGIFTLV